MFSCEICEDALCEYNVTLTDMTKAELCESCLDMMEKDGKVLLSQKFVGLTQEGKVN